MTHKQGADLFSFLDEPSPARTPLPMNYEDVASLAASLTPENFCFAVRIVSYYAAFGRGMPEAVATTFLGVSKRKWGKIAEALRPYFEVVDGRWFLPSSKALYRQSLSTSSWAGEDAIGMRTKHANSFAMSAARGASQPLSEAGSIFSGEITGQNYRDKPASLAQHIFKAGVILLVKAGRTESQSRQCIAKLLKDWSEGDVAEAIDAAMKHDPIDPYSWMRARLKAVAPKKGAGNYASFPPAQRQFVLPARPIATPDIVGVSEGMAARIKAAAARHCSGPFPDEGEQDEHQKESDT